MFLWGVGIGAMDHTKTTFNVICLEEFPIVRLGDSESLGLGVMADSAIT